MSALFETIKALLRRLAIIAGSGILAFVLTQWPVWTEKAVKTDPATAVAWPIIYFIIEFMQKYLRERAKYDNGLWK